MFPYIIDKTPLGRDAFPVEFEPRNGLTSVLINNIRVTQRDLVFQTKFLNYKIARRCLRKFGAAAIGVAAMGAAAIGLAVLKKE